MDTESPKILTQLFESNQQWAADVARTRPTFFSDSAKGQTPKVLWIGCADSRVPETVLLACAPGDIFVHRNIANQFHPDDVSALSVLQYAVEEVGVEHIIIAGHTGCGGAAACYEGACGRLPVDPKSTLASWLTPLVELAKELDVDQAESKDVALSYLIEENVRRQVANVAASDVMQGTWKDGKNVTVHGWIYTLDTGLIRDLGVSQGLAGGQY